MANPAAEQHRDKILISPEVAVRFTVIELAGAALWTVGLMNKQSRETLQRAIDIFEWPAPMLTRLLQMMQEPVRIEALEKNPFLQPEQVLLLYCTLLLNAPGEGIPQGWAKLYQLSESEQNFIQEALQQSRITPSAPPSAGAFFEPPDELLPFIQRLYRRLAVGAAELKYIGHIPPHFYEHDWDRKALHQMKSITGFELAMRKFSEWHFEKMQAVLSQAQRIEVSEEQFPELYALWMVCCERAGFGENPPDFYVELGPLNAFTTGVERPQVIVSSALLSLLTPRELMFVLGHELGHIRSEHVLYTMFAMGFPRFAEIVGNITLGLGNLLGAGLELAVMDWQRKAELTCDRFGLLCCQDFQAALNVLIKLAGAPPLYFDKINWEAFAEQGRAYEEDANLHSKLYQWFSTAYQSHPWPTVRAHQLRLWVDSGRYEQLLESSKSHRAPVAAQPHEGSRSCIRCESVLAPGDLFCADCGMRVVAPGDQGPLFCTNCGFDSLHEDDRFCPDCGMPL